MKKIIVRFSNSSGLSLVEMILYMGLLLVLLSVLTRLFTSSLEVQLESESVSSIQQDGRYILSRLAYDMQRATTVSNPLLVGSSSATLQMTINSISHTYSVDAQNNFIVSNALGQNALTSYDASMSGFLVQRIGNSGGTEDTFRISFILTSRSQDVGGKESKQYQTTISLRRK